MEPPPAARWLLLLPLLLLLLPPGPELGPGQAHAEETDWVRLPSKCEGEGAGPRDGPAGGAGLAGNAGGRGARKVPAPEPDAGDAGAGERWVSVHLELTDP